MMQGQRHRIFIWLLELCLCGSSLSAWAIPATVNISGQLLDKSGNPVKYMHPTVPATQIQVNLAAKVRLYDSPSTSTLPFATLSATASAYDGIFNITFALPETAVTKDSLWYAVSIDADRNGLSSSDDFPDRLGISAVPFALSAKALKNFTTFGGTRGGGGSPTKFSGFMNVVPFETPAGGVEFNRMNVLLVSGKPGDAFEFGLYDENGTRLATSGLIPITGSATLTNAFLQVKTSKITLKPSATYYIGLARNNVSLALPYGLMPVSPVMGWVTLTKTTGEIPTSFDPATIEPSINAQALPVTFNLADEAAAPKAEWISSKTGGPQYRWIISK